MSFGRSAITDSLEVALQNLAVTARRLVPAAQYIRMSTEHQRYSLDNQRTAISTYAAERGFEIVETYEDAGKSGLTLRGRSGLKRLLGDVLAGAVGYRAILVLDVGRWGRFQDTDQSAHYEYMCREAGLEVHYCNEQFENDGGPVASILKHMKRVMAAEYSRELSRKVSRAQRQQASLGYKQGGSAPLGLRRQVIDQTGKARLILGPGERKALSSDKVIYVRGPAQEIAMVRRAFRMMAEKHMRLGDIAASMNKVGSRQPSGRVWSSSALRHLLTNKLYVGQYVFGRRFNNLGAYDPRPPDEWISVEVLQPIVDPALFEATQERLRKTTRLHLNDEQLHDGLSRLLAEHGLLSSELIRSCPYLPGPEACAKRYGSLEAAFRSVGYEKPTRKKVDSSGRPYSDNDLVMILRRIHHERGFLSGQAIDEDASTPNRQFFIRRFGGLIKAFGLAGIETTPREQWKAAQMRLRRDRPDEARSRKHPKSTDPKGEAWTKLTLIEALRGLLAEHNYLSAKLINASPDLPCSNFFAQRFGGLMNAYKAAGYYDQQSTIMAAVWRRKRSAP